MSIIQDIKTGKIVKKVLNTPNYEKLYHELLYTVEQKIPGETRHQSALRLIRKAQISNSRECGV